MKKRTRRVPTPPPADPVVDAALPERPRRLAKCTVCGSSTSPNSGEGLCWVCRRLKISAWRDSDNQLNAQE